MKNGKRNLNLLSYIGRCIDDGRVADPQVAWWHPSAGEFVSLDLCWASDLRHNVCNGRAGASIADEVERSNLQVLVDNSSPGVAVTPPLEVVVTFGVVAYDIYAGVVAELELDGVCGHKTT